MDQTFKTRLNTLMTAGGRTFVLYLLAFLVLGQIVDQEVLKIKRLNYLLPDFQDLWEVQRNPQRIDQQDLYKYVDYFQQVLAYIPDLPDAHAVLGFCYYQLGKPKKAVASYQKAIAQESHFFWNHYNVGVIYFKNKEYAQAVTSLKEAVQKSPDRTIYIMGLSKIYRDIRQAIEVPGFAWPRSLKLGYQQGYGLLILSYEHLGQYQDMFTAAATAIAAQVGNKAQFYYYAGRAKYEMKQYPKTIAYLEECLKRDSSHVEALHYLGLTLEQLGKTKDAIQVFRQEELLRKKGKGVASEEETARVKIF